MAKTLVDGGRNFGELFGRSSAMGRIAGGKHPAHRVAHYVHADTNMADADAKIDDRLPFPCGVPARHIMGAEFKFEGGGNAVAGLIFIIPRLLAVRSEERRV